MCASAHTEFAEVRTRRPRGAERLALPHYQSARENLELPRASRVRIINRSAIVVQKKSEHQSKKHRHVKNLRFRGGFRLSHVLQPSFCASNMKQSN